MPVHQEVFKNKLCLKVDITSNVLIISTCHLIQSYPPLRASNLLIVRLLLIVSQIYCISVLAYTVEVLFVFTLKKCPTKDSHGEQEAKQLLTS